MDEVAGRLHLPAESARSLLEKLRSANVVCFVDNGAEGAACVLARPAERIPILDIMGVISNGDGRDASARAYQADIAAQVGRTWTRARSAMSGLTLADAMGGAPAERSAQG